MLCWYWDVEVLCLGVCISIQSVSIVSCCDLLVVTGDVIFLLVIMWDMSCRIICSLSIYSSFVVVLIFSMSVFTCVVLSSAPLAAAIAS